MTIKPDYILRQVMDFYIVLGVDSAYAPNQIMSLNETGAFLWEYLKDGAEPDELVKHLVKEFEVDEEAAEKDVDTFLTQLRENGLIDE